MDFLAKFLLALLYVLILPLRWVRMLLGHDRIRLRRPQNANSYWIIRDNSPDSQSYFLETSVAEGRGDRGAARWVTPVLRMIARAYAPSRELSGSHPTAAE